MLSSGFRCTWGPKAHGCGGIFGFGFKAWAPVTGVQEPEGMALSPWPISGGFCIEIIWP